MGFLERSRSLRRKDSAVPLRKPEQAPATRPAVKGTSTPPISSQDARSRPSTGKSARSFQRDQKEASRPRAASSANRDRVYRREQQPPLPDFAVDQQVFRFPTPTDSPRASTSHSRKLTFHANGSTTTLGSNGPPRAPEYKRSFTSPIPQATIHQGAVKLSKELPALEEAAPAAPKRPTLHKSRSSTWRSFFQRKQSRPPVPDFDPAEYKLAPPLPKSNITSPAEQHPAPPPPPPKVVDHSRTQSRGVTRHTRRAEMDKAEFDKRKAALASQATPAPNEAPRQTRPELPRSATTSALAPTEQQFDALSRNSSMTGVASPMGKGPRLEVSIPTVELDRYSVMFEKLLQPKTSLLERRKTTLQGLQLPGEPSKSGKLTPSAGTPGRPQRRATSPNINVPTPLTAEFIESSSQIATPVAMQRVSGVPRSMLRRSKTAPPGAISPARAQFEDKVKSQQRPRTQQQRQQQQQQAPEDASATSTHHSPIWSEASLPATPDTTSETGTFMSLDDEDDDDDDEEEEEEEAEIVTYDTKALKPTLKEPNWHMVTPTNTSGSGSGSSATMAPPIPPKAPGRASREPSMERADQHPPRTSSLDSRASDEASSKRQHAQPQPPSQQREPHPHPLQMNQVHRPVQVSIARQISVRRPSGPQSRASKAITIAAATTTAAATPTIAEPSPMYSKQPLRPRVVEVRNRKSTMVVLDNATAGASRESLLPGSR